jgi:hypothetical protein
LIGTPGSDRLTAQHTPDELRLDDRPSRSIGDFDTARLPASVDEERLVASALHAKSCDAEP